MKIAIVGATGAVGRELLSCLESRRFPVSELVPFASARSKGKEVRLGGRGFAVRVMEPGCFRGVDMAFFDASDAVSKEWVPRAAEEGAWAVDNSAAFRMDADVPLLVPEVNGQLIADRLARVAKLSARERILAGPNCSTVQLVLPLLALHKAFGLKRVVVSSYQSVSGAGTAAIDELAAQARAVLAGQASGSGTAAVAVATGSAFPQPIAFNCIPRIGGIKDDGYTGEESKIMAETRKILGLPSLRITATAVRVPTFSCHGESVNVECERRVDLAAAREALRAQAGVILQDELAKDVYPVGLGRVGGQEGASGRDASYVGRLRLDASVENGLNLWVVSDNLRKGAALNAVQIGEALLGRAGA